MSFLLNFQELIIHSILIVGIIGVFLGFFLNAIPVLTPYKSMVQVLAVLLVLVGVWGEGWLANEKKHLAKYEEYKAQIKILEERSGRVEVVIKEVIVEKVKKVKENVYINRDVIKEVAGGQIDSMCTLPNSAISLHNNASRDQVTPYSEGANGTPSTVKASRLLDTVVDNYGSCNINAQKLLQWQNWYRENEKIFNSQSKSKNQSEVDFDSK